MTSTDAATEGGTRGRRLGRARAYGVVVAVILVGAGLLIRNSWEHGNGPAPQLDIVASAGLIDGL